MTRSLVLLLVISLVGCGGKQALSPNVDEDVQRKVDFMTKIAEGTESANPEFAAMAALEKYRGIPFQAKSQPEAARKILEIYNARVKGKLRGEAGVQVAGEMSMLETELK